MVVGAAAGVGMVSAMLLRSDLVVLVLMADCLDAVMSVPVLGQLSFDLYAEAAHRAQHARSQHAPNGE